MGEIAGTCLQSTLIILLPFLGCRMLISPLSSYWNLYMIFLKFRTNHTKWSNITFHIHSTERVLLNDAQSFRLFQVLNHSKEGQVCEIYFGVNPRTNSENYFELIRHLFPFLSGGQRQSFDKYAMCAYYVKRSVFAIFRWSWWGLRRAAYPSGQRGRHHPPFVN